MSCETFLLICSSAKFLILTQSKARRCSRKSVSIFEHRTDDGGWNPDQEHIKNDLERIMVLLRVGNKRVTVALNVETITLAVRD